MNSMDPELAELSRTIDPAELGRRIKNARIAAGLTQGQAADGKVSTPYLSRIEAGQRRPDLKLLAVLAERTGTTLDALLLGRTSDEQGELLLEVARAEFALRTGDAAGAWDQAVALAEKAEQAATLPSGRAVVDQIRAIQAHALVALGSVDDAVLRLEDLVALGPTSPHWTRSVAALVECYRVTGDLTGAVEIGNRALDHLREIDLVGGDDAVRVANALAATHLAQGDVDLAAAVARQALGGTGDDPADLAASYEQAGRAEASAGRVGPALDLTERAVAILDENERVVRVARLRAHLAASLLRLDPPDAKEALSLYEAASNDLEGRGADATEVGGNTVGLARALLLTGDPDRALATLEPLLSGDSSPLIGVQALVLRGQVRTQANKRKAAATDFVAAFDQLSKIGTPPESGQIWFELGEHLERIGEAEKALAAYRNSAASTGLRRAATAAPARR